MQVQKFSNLTFVAFVLALMTVAGAASAAPPDVTAAVTAINDMLVPIGLLGAAGLIVAVTIKSWKRFRGAA